MFTTYSTIILYSLALALLLPGLKQPRLLLQRLALVSSWLAAALHARLLHQWIDGGSGQNLIWVNLVSLQVWLTLLLILTIGIFKPIQNLLLVILPVAVISILLVLVVPGQHIVFTAAEPKQLIHILLSALTLSVLSVAALQAVMMAWHEWGIRKHNNWVGFLPALEVMESVLFQILNAGFILLSILLISSMLAYKAMVLTVLIKKTLLSVLAWLILALLLFGHRYLGWRGAKAIRWSLTGIVLLIIVYFCAQALIGKVTYV